MYSIGEAITLAILKTDFRPASWKADQTVQKKKDSKTHKKREDFFKEVTTPVLKGMMSSPDPMQAISRGFEEGYDSSLYREISKLDERTGGLFYSFIAGLIEYRDAIKDDQERSDIETILVQAKATGDKPKNADDGLKIAKARSDFFKALKSWAEKVPPNSNATLEKTQSVVALCYFVASALKITVQNRDRNTTHKMAALYLKKVKKLNLEDIQVKLETLCPLFFEKYKRGAAKLDEYERLEKQRLDSESDSTFFQTQLNAAKPEIKKAKEAAEKRKRQYESDQTRLTTLKEKINKADTLAEKQQIFYTFGDDAEFEACLKLLDITSKERDQYFTTRESYHQSGLVTNLWHLWGGASLSQDHFSQIKEKLDAKLSSLSNDILDCQSTIFSCTNGEERIEVCLASLGTLPEVNEIKPVSAAASLQKNDTTPYLQFLSNTAEELETSIENLMEQQDLLIPWLNTVEDFERVENSLLNVTHVGIKERTEKMTDDMYKKVIPTDDQTAESHSKKMEQLKEYHDKTIPKLRIAHLEWKVAVSKGIDSLESIIQNNKATKVSFLTKLFSPTYAKCIDSITKIHNEYRKQEKAGKVVNMKDYYKDINDAISLAMTPKRREFRSRAKVDKLLAAINETKPSRSP